MEFATARIAVIGAGMAGAACATALQAVGRSVSLFDKGRGPGGRMSARSVTVGEDIVRFDHGAQYFTARNSGFRAQVAAWHARGIVAPWPAAGAGAWVGTPAMNRPVATLCTALDVTFQAHVSGLRRDPSGWRLNGEGVDSGPYAQVVIAAPAEQAAGLLADIDGVSDQCLVDPALFERIQATRSEPCWTVMAVWESPLAFSLDTYRGAGDIIWAARNSAKPGRSGPEAWVIQASPVWSRAHRGADPAEVCADVLRLFAETCRVPVPTPAFVQAHSWLYARSGSLGQACIWDAGLGLGVCGDWLIGPRVEAAWLSGTSLAAEMNGVYVNTASTGRRAE
ncbi:NAD(P)/FAD-dependent oxidoreductase [Asticcacaulis sp. AC402]|uniref:NAD(P)/FAD-dependent oxidoreductase n=1 Tax=Asticcacaulis sp. AC402 TaxID=1282361 RepID=UPI0003C3CBCA|nr:NAD(P)-binding protein [Asticcacaulis sp. AC402]ESQ76096.1 hypothetical protein ABAC402_06515 [Asticcacaulis sp. AC402]